MNEINKTIKSILYERMRSPFWFLLVTSWVFWNWKQIYLTLFVSSDKLEMTKLDYITEHLNPNNFQLFLYPLLSTIFLLTVGDYINTYAYQIHLYFKKRRRDIQKKYDDSKVLDENESNEIKLESLRLRNEFSRMTKFKDDEIYRLKDELNLLVEKDTEQNKNFNKLQTQYINSNKESDPREIFRGTWTYSLENEMPITINFPSRYEIEFKDNRDERFSIRVIQTYGSKEYLIYLGESDYDDDGRQGYTIWELKRSNNPEILRGIETTVQLPNKTMTVKHIEFRKLTNK